MNKFDLLIFDLDGTLLDTAPDVLTCANIALAEMGLPQLTLEQIKKAIGPGPDNFVRITLGESNLHRREEFYTIFRSCYIEKCADKTRLFPGVRELLDQLPPLKLSVATNKPLVYSEKILRHLNLSDSFDLVVGPELVKHVKPHPGMVEYALKHFRIDPSRALMIGDTDNDILSAQAAHVRTCAVGWGYSDINDLKKLAPDYIVNEPGELLDILQLKPVAEEIRNSR